LADDQSLPEDSPLVEWRELFTEIGERTGKTFAVSEALRDSIEAAGFVNVK